MVDTGTHTLHEITTQADAWAAILPAVREQAESWAAFVEREEAALTLFFGCGSTHYLSMTAASVFQTFTGQPARAAPSAELFLFPDTWIPARRPLHGLAISRSGTTTETLRAADYLAETYQAHLACVTCYGDTPMTDRCEFGLISPQGHEQSVAQTRSFSSMLVGCIALAALASRQADTLDQLSRLPSVGERLMRENESLAQSLGQDLNITQVFFLGSGPRYGLACEAMLKLKEMSLTTSEAYHFLEFRHGPKSMVDANTLVVGLLSDAAREPEKAVLREMKGLGAKTLVLSESADDLTWADHVVRFESELPEVCRLPFYLPILQLFAYHRAVGKGLNPDAPRHLDAVVQL